MMDKLVSKYISQDSYITNKYPNKFAPKKFNRYCCEGIYLSKNL